MPSRKPGRKREREREESRRLPRVALSLLVSLVPVWCIILQQPNTNTSILSVEDYFLATTTEQLKKKTKTYGRVGESKNISTATAYQQSFGFFDDIPDAAWQRLQVRARTTPLYYYYYYYGNSNDTATTANHDKAVVHNAGWWYAHNLPPVFNCFNMERVGGLDDGPKWTCDPYRLLGRPNCLIYSIGSAGQYQWEKGLVQRLGSHCEIHVFDPGNYSRSDLPANVHYHQWGLKSSYDLDYAPSLYKNINPDEMLTFQETLRRLGHENRVIDIFKLDCEKCEWSSYKDWIGGNIRQIIIEVHGVPSPFGPNDVHHRAMNVSDFFDAFRNNGFALYFKEPNVYVRGSCVELGYIKLRSDFWSDD